jgi:hypothetical protein
MLSGFFFLFAVIKKGELRNKVKQMETREMQDKAGHKLQSKKKNAICEQNNKCECVTF